MSDDEPTGFVAISRFGRLDRLGDARTDGTLEVCLAAARQDLERGALAVDIRPAEKRPA